MSEPLLVYCTPPAKRYAAALARAVEAACGCPVIVAPLTRQDLLTAVTSRRAGDFVVTLDAGLEAELAGLRLVKGVQELGELALCAVTAGAEPFEDLWVPGNRLGMGSPKGVLGRATAKALPAPLRDAAAARVRHRSERCDELVRMVRLGALDTALVWEPCSLPEGLRSLAVPGAASAGRVYAIQLSCSRQSADRLSGVRAAWSGAMGKAELRGQGVRFGAGGGGA